MAALPTENDLARDIGTDVDPEAIFLARKALRDGVGHLLSQRLLTLYDKLQSDAPYSPDAASAGRRALRNACLDLYAAGNHSDGAEIALSQFQRATNMTDKMGALSVLSRLPTPAREKALEFFYRAHCDEPLIIDKWFSLQATIPEPDTLSRVKRLTKVHAFNIATPNRVYALIGAFANGNPYCFNDVERRGLPVRRRSRAAGRRGESAGRGAAACRRSAPGATWRPAAARSPNRRSGKCLRPRSFRQTCAI